MDAVIQDFEPRCGGEEAPQFPRRVGADFDREIVQVADCARFVRSFCGEDGGTPAQLEVDGGAQVLTPAECEQGFRFCERFAHGLLDEDRGAIGKQGDDARLMLRWRGNVEHVRHRRIESSEDFFDGCDGDWDAELGGQLACFRDVRVDERGDRVPRLCDTPGGVRRARCRRRR